MATLSVLQLAISHAAEIKMLVLAEVLSVIYRKPALSPNIWNLLP